MSTLTPEALSAIGSDIRTHGFAVVRGVIDADTMADVAKQWDRLRGPLANGRSIDGVRRDNFYIHGELPAPVGTLYRHPSVVAIATELLGPGLAMYLNRLNVKDTNFTDAIHLHQDMPYFNGLKRKYNFFVPLQRVNFNNGAMAYVPKSHDIGELNRDTIDISMHPELDVVIPTLEPGDLVIADIMLWHSSVPNSQGTDRVLLQMIFQPSDDGSWYPPSIDAPRLVQGEWATDEFPPWQTAAPAGSAMTASTEPDPDPASAESTVTVAPPSSPGVVAQPSVKLVMRLRAKLRLRSRARAVKRRLGRVAQLRDRVRRPVAPTSSAPAGPSASDVALPELFTPSTGPKQVPPRPESLIDWPSELEPAIRCLRGSGKKRILLATTGVREKAAEDRLRASGFEVAGYILVLLGPEDVPPRWIGTTVYRPVDIPGLIGIDAIIVLATIEFSLVVRRCEQYLRPDILFLPGSVEAIVPAAVRDCSIGEWATRSSILTYLYISGLRGHFAEFGTFWGRAFYNSYFELSHWLEGNFYAFDSFAGLSEPDPLEQSYTNQDFKRGAYGYSRDSFEAIGPMLGIPKDRLVVTPGFFDVSLTPELPAAIGMAERSLSVCRIDCDLLDPTLSVLDFIAPLLDDGALLYFDDWRLCRASPNLGERGAVIRWLDRNPRFDLTEFHSLHWQHQWFIFNRDRPISER